MDSAGNDPVRNGLNERVARLEAEVQALRAEIVTLGAVVLPPVTTMATPLMPVEPKMSIGVMRGVEPSQVQVDPPIFGSAKSRVKQGESLEGQIGAKILSKVAVVLLLIGVALFLKWAFDNRWIGAGGRVAAGLLVGAAVVVWSERFRKQQLTAFTYALKAVGSGVLYLSLWASFQLYHLVPSWVAFAAMVLVTAWNTVMALSQDAELLAGYALLGAYLTPVLLGTGENHEVFLFSYLLIIAAGLLVLLRSKPWGMLTIGALPATAVFFFFWFREFFQQSSLGMTIVFALLLWAVFAAMPLVTVEVDGVVAVVLLPLGSAVFGAAAMYAVLAQSGSKVWEPWCAVVFALVYLGFARMRAKRLLSAMHVSLGVVFLTVAIPLKATGRGILLGWLVEAVALLVVSTVEGIDQRAKGVLRGLGSATLGLGVVGALVQPEWLGGDVQAFWNRGFALRMGSVIALALAIGISQRMRDEKGSLEGAKIAVGAYVLANVVLLIAMHSELSRYFESEQPTLEGWGRGRAVGDFAFSAWMMVQGVVSLIGGFWRRVALARWIGLLLLATTVVKAFAWDMRGLSAGYRVVSYLVLGMLLMAVSFAYQRDWMGIRVLTSTDNSEVQG